MHKITIYPGFDKDHNPENFDVLNLYPSKIYAIVGNTGSGKSRLLKDIEQLVNKDSISKRVVTIDNQQIDIEQRFTCTNQMIAHLSQNMRFTLDITVDEFINLHKSCRKKDIPNSEVIHLANTITAEPIHSSMSLNLLSGGQSRALMIADIACICDSPIVLIDEIENAGIDKMKAMYALCKQNKIILIVTHDVHTALLANERIIMNNGSISMILAKNKAEETLCKQLGVAYQKQLDMQKRLRTGEHCI